MEEKYLTLDNIELISKFMNWMTIEEYSPYTTIKPGFRQSKVWHCEIEYNWLMLVVEKIQKITTFDIRYCRSETDEIYTECTTFKHGYLIENENPLIAIYEKCINFITSYNLDIQLQEYAESIKK